MWGTFIKRRQFKMFMMVNQTFDRNFHGFFMRRTLSSRQASFGA
jgi:hypothetical protein